MEQPWSNPGALTEILSDSEFAIEESWESADRSDCRWAIQVESVGELLVNVPVKTNYRRAWKKELNVTECLYARNNQIMYRVSSDLGNVSIPSSR